MPGPKMGPRPPDFDEVVIKQSPTYVKWSKLQNGEKMKYACRVFIKGRGNDDERLMRRILIARRNNIKDHETLKQARTLLAPPPPPATEDAENARSASPENSCVPATAMPPPDRQELQAPSTATNDEASHEGMELDHFSEDNEQDEMDVLAVESTRSYRAWSELPFGAEFVYNQRYIKGAEGHDWLLRKNIWRRMKYRRGNKRLVERFRQHQQYPSQASLPKPLARKSRPMDSGKRPAACDKRPRTAYYYQSSSPGTLQEGGSLPLSNQASPLRRPTRRLANSAVLTSAMIHAPLLRPQTDLAHDDTTSNPLLRSDSAASGHEDDGNTEALQASAAAAAALFEQGDQNAIMDAEAVAAAVAAAESFRSSTEAALPVHDPILAAAIAATDIPKEESLELKATSLHQESALFPLPQPHPPLDHLVHTPGTSSIVGSADEVFVHDPLEAAALAAQLAAVTGATADLDVAQTIGL